MAAVNQGDYQLTLGGWSGLLDTDSNAWSVLHSGRALNVSHSANPRWTIGWIRRGWPSR